MNLKNAIIKISTQLLYIVIKGGDWVFWNRMLLYKGKSKERYNEIRNILELNGVRYTEKIENKNKDKGPMIDKIIVGTWPKSENYSYEYFIFVNKDDYDIANSLITT